MAPESRAGSQRLAPARRITTRSAAGSNSKPLWRRKPMKRIEFVVIALVISGATESRADLIPVTASDFAPGAQVITFETGSTALPTVPGVTFLQTPPSATQWYGSSANFNGFFGNQGWSNLVSATY